MRKLILLAERMYEDLELWYPRLRLEEEGFTVVVAGPEARTYEGKHGVPVVAEVQASAICVDEVVGLIIPGGFAPDWLRRYPEVLELVRRTDDAKKLVAFICHGGWVVISAGRVKGRRVTSLPAIRDDMVNAGGIWLDEAVVVDGNFVSSRRPADLPVFCRAILGVLGQQR